MNLDKARQAAELIERAMSMLIEVKRAVPEPQDDDDPEWENYGRVEEAIDTLRTVLDSLELLEH